VVEAGGSITPTKDKPMTDETIEEQASAIAINTLNGAAYTSGVTDVIVLICKRILVNHKPEDQPALFKNLYDELVTAFASIEAPSVLDIIQLALDSPGRTPDRWGPRDIAAFRQRTNQ
jgi:hypothetical protein